MPVKVVKDKRERGTLPSCAKEVMEAKRAFLNLTL